MKAAARGRFTTSVLRGGQFYASDAAHTRLFGEALARHRLPIIGRKETVWALIHADDAASAFVAAAESGRGGVWHVVDDEPVTAAKFLTTLAARIEARPPSRVPAWLARLVAGREETRELAASTRTSNARIKADMDWRPKFPTYREGVAEVVAAWGAEGFPAR